MLLQKEVPELLGSTGSVCCFTDGPVKDIMFWFDYSSKKDELPGCIKLLIYSRINGNLVLKNK